MQFGCHLLHAVNDRCELVSRLTEHHVGFAGALIVDLGHRFDRLTAFVLNRKTHALKLMTDSGGYVSGALSHRLRDFMSAHFGCI